VSAWLRFVVAGEESDEADIGEALVGEFICDARLLAFGKTRKEG
jgi:hypothetical protein